MVANGMEGVPWMVGGGAKHSANVGRVLAYMAAGGQAGITSPGDLKVSPSAPIDGNVHVGVGALSILNGEGNAKNEAYIGRATAVSDVPISPTGSSARSDLVVIRVRDPQYSYAAPTDRTVGPYIFPEVVPGVPAGTVHAEQVASLLNKAVYALGRVDMPPNTTNVQGGYIADLRELAHQRYKAINQLQRGPTPSEVVALTDTNWKNFPSNSLAVPVPFWATHADVEMMVTMVLDGNANMDTRISFGSLTTGTTPFDANVIPQGGNSVMQQHSVQGVGLDVRSQAGQTITMRMQAMRTFLGDTGTLGIGQSGQVRFRVEFYEKPL
jgi:hypothetical protein